MHEPENLHEALKTLIDYNASVWTIIRDDNGKKREARIEDLQDVNLDVPYAMCDLLGMDDLIND